MGLVRIATAGSVDDGKSTLIGRLLWETESLLDDQVASVREASARRGEELQLALVLDGLRAEREQNITIDVAYRPFHGGRHRFILADSPGHVQYTRNMVTGASTADAVVILADAQRGLQTQSMRHLAVCRLLRVPRIILAINKMDLVGYDRRVFDEMVEGLERFARRFGELDVAAIPISALVGDNVTAHSPQMPWYDGPTLLELLDALEPTNAQASAATLPVQNVLLGADQSRYYAGTVLGSPLSVGQCIETTSGQSSRIKRILSLGDCVLQADPGRPVAVQLEHEIDVGRGDWLMDADRDRPRSRKIRAVLFWLQDDPLRIGLSYVFRQGPKTVLAKVTRILGGLNLENGDYEPAGVLALNDIGLVEISLGEETVVERYADSRELGSFILVDPHHQTSAAGLVTELLSNSNGTYRSHGTVFWLTGLSGAGKTTVAEAFVQRLKARGMPAVHLDGDVLRSGLCSDLGFSHEDRFENIRRTAEVAKLFAAQGFVTVCSLISPLLAQRELAGKIIADSFCEVYVRCDLEECIRRDPKGLYARAMEGTIRGFTGIGAPYEPPTQPQLTIDTQSRSLDECLDVLMDYLNEKGTVE
jgi:bifunctional enzyme CysN/CysC